MMDRRFNRVCFFQMTHAAAMSFWLTLAALLSVAALAPADQPKWTRPATSQSIELPAADKLAAPRLLGPRYVYDATARFRLDAPAKWAPKVAPDDEDFTLSFTVHVTQGERTATATGEAEPDFDWNRKKRQMELASFTGEAIVDLSGFADGPIEAWATLERPGGAGEPARVELAGLNTKPQIVRGAFKKVASEHRAELASWIDDANAQRRIWGKVPTWGNLSKALRQTDDPYAGLRGFMLRSYENPQLRRRQPYTVYVPKSLDLSEPAPLMILLHGSGGDYRNLIADEFAGQRFEEHPMLIANAGAYRNQEFRHMALNDIRWIVEDMKKKYDVDAGRVYLQGISLGGRGTIEAAALMPDTFAAISPQGVYGVQLHHLDPATFAERDKAAAGLMAKADILTWTLNLANTPAEIVWALHDEATPPANALLVGEMIDRAGPDARAVMRGFDSGHNITLPDYDWASTRKWMLEHKLNRQPNYIRHRVSNLRYNTNRWVTVHAMHDYAHVGDVLAVYDPKKKTLRTFTENVIAASFVPPGPVDRVITRGGTADVKWTPKMSRAITMFFDDEGRVLNQAPDIFREGFVKKRGRSGPIWDVWSEPVVYVWDDGEGSPAERLKKSVERSSRWDMAYDGRHLPHKPASELTDAEKSGGNVIIFTADAAASPLLKQMKIDWPTVPGLAAKDRPIRVMLRPSPWSDEHSVLIVESRFDQAFSLHQFGWWDKAFHGDWVYGAPVPDPRGPGPDGRPRYRRNLRVTAAGVFDHAWQPGSHTRRDPRTRDLLPHRR